MPRLLFWAIAGFSGGVWFRSFVDFGWPLILFFFGLAGAFFLCWRFWVTAGRLPDRQARQVFLIAGVLSVFFGLGLVRLALAESAAARRLDPLAHRQIVLEGVVVEEPDERENSAKLTVKLAGESAKILVTVPLASEIRYGDRVRLTGQLVRPKNFLTAAGKKFDYLSYLAKDNIFYQMFYPRIERLAAGQGFWLQERLFALKAAWLKRITTLLPEPPASLAGGLVVGARQGLGEEWQRAFRRTGIIHIVVLSGYNVMVVADNLMKGLAYFFPRYLGLGLGGLAIVLFALLTGAGPTVVRASLMALIALLARATGRVYQATIALLFTVFIMLLHNPKILVFDPGFQLSFLATLGLLYLAPLLENRLWFLTRLWHLRSIVASTLAAQLAVLPWLLYKMGEWSLVALPVNLLILPLIPATMLFIFLTGLLGFFSLWAAKPLAYLSYALLAYALKVVELFSALPFAAIKISAFPLALVVLIYLGYGFLIVRTLKNR